MDTPIYDFVRAYAAKDPVRLHMPGHKGQTYIGPEPLDITEITGADVLYRASGIVKESENHASELFGTGMTLYSTEGSSLAIKAMLALTKLSAGSRRPRILAVRNAHKSISDAAALLDIDVEWVWPDERGYIAPETIEREAERYSPDALYVTSPDFLGVRADIPAIGDICHRRGIALLVDNAHGAYLKFLRPSLHPMDLGADMCSDSAHKTLPVLTGGAYLHIAKEAPEIFAREAERALRVFASTSPSYLILASLDLCNRLLADELPALIRLAAERVAKLRKELMGLGFCFLGDEPLKLTIDAPGSGYSGRELGAFLENAGIYPEMYSREVVILMFAADTAESEFERVRTAFSEVSRRRRLPASSLPVRKAQPPEKAASLHEAFWAERELISVDEASGRVLAEIVDICPPCVPIALPGERLDAALTEALKAIGADRVFVLK